MNAPHNNNKCLESKCVSKGRSIFTGQSDPLLSPYTCYGDDGTFYPKLCADGYLPLTLDEPLEFTAAWDPYSPAAPSPDYSKNVSVEYFTCCPPVNITENLSPEATTRHCSDPIMIDGSPEIPPTICEGDNKSRIFPHRRKTGGILTWRVDSVICCDYEENTNATDNFLETLECVPYRTDDMYTQYTPAKIYPNQLNWAFPVGCELPDFPIPRPLEDSHTFADVRSAGIFQCCRNGTPLPYYVKDSTYWASKLVLPVVYSLATLASLWVIVGLSVPLIIQLKGGTYQGTDGASQRASQRTSQRKRGVGPTYSSYNLYLVYLAFPDLVLTVLTLPMLLGYNDLSFRYQKWVFGALAFHSISNQWLNAIVMYRVLQILQSSRNATRIQPPTLQRVSLDTFLSYLLGIAGGVMGCISNMDMILGNLQRGIPMTIVGGLLSIIPLAYGLFVAGLVWKRGYLRIASENASPRDRAMRDLAIYFFRIVFIFVFLWVPTMIIAGMRAFNHSLSDWALFTGWFFQGIQPILTTCAILTKADCRKYLLDLVTFSYCRRRGNVSNSNKTSSLIVKPIATRKSDEPGESGNDGTNQSEPSSNSKINEPDVEVGDSAARTAEVSEPRSSLEDSNSSEVPVKVGRITVC